MQKQKKIVPKKKNKYFLKKSKEAIILKKFRLKIVKKKSKKFFKKNLKRSNLNFKKAKILKFFYNKYLRFKSQISITITQNNVFCVYQSNLTSNNKKVKTIVLTSAGKYKIKVSKKKLKFSNKIIIEKFINRIIPRLKKKDRQFLLINISGPIRVKKSILKQIRSLIKETKIKYILNTKSLKCFNGCRPKKQKRKKQKSFRILKPSI